MLHLVGVKKDKIFVTNNTNFCEKGWHNGDCCCNCTNHLEDFHHCTTLPKTEGNEGCVCSTNKWWVCRMGFEGNGEVRYHSGLAEYGMCEMHTPRSFRLADNVFIN